MVIAGIMMCLMMLHISADVFFKYTFNRPIFGTVETVQYYYMIGAVYLPLAFVQLRGGQISVELLFNRLPAWGQRAADGCALICTIVFFGILAYQSWLDAVNSWQIGEIVMGSATTPIWPSRFFLPISFGLVCLVSMLRLIDEVILGKPLPSSGLLMNE
jgi:TRAP-type C4-dicarboxylate transport system permease small subunit